MTDLVHARVVDHLARLRLGHVAERFDALLSEAAKKDVSYLAFLDRLLAEELASKQRKRMAMGIQIAHIPSVKTLEEFDFKFQPSLDQKLIRELATGRFVAGAENVLVFGPPGVGKTHLAIALGRAVVEMGHSVLFVSATSLLASLARAEADGTFDAKLAFFAKPKLLIIDELGYLPLEMGEEVVVVALAVHHVNRRTRTSKCRRSGIYVARPLDRMVYWCRGIRLDS